MQIDFSKSTDGLVPVIIQDNYSAKVLMLGYMNQEALDKSQQTGNVTFYSRSKNRLWMKGEDSGNVLKMNSIHVDCDKDTILIKATPHGPTCHNGTISCFADENDSGLLFIKKLEETIADRLINKQESSYTADLVSRGIHKVAQKVGEEAVELVIEAMQDKKELFLGEAADLLFHYLILLQTKGLTMDDVIKVLQTRHNK